MKAFCITSIMVLALCGASASAQDRVPDSVGPAPAQALSGDTLDFGGVQVRLYGIQAPHLDQTCRTRKDKMQQCGRMATLALAEMVRGQKVRCEAKGQDAQGRLQALCFVGWMNLSEEMAASGYAMADPDTGADFVRAETFAKARREALWQSEFTPPWEWRGE
jgi:endonuclease YncB( thermonuclease family)